MEKSIMTHALNYCKKTGDRSLIFTANGFQIHGCVKKYDEDSVVVINDKGETQIVQRNNISTVVPPKGYRYDS